MPRTCTVCAHADRAAIDAALVQGRPIRDISLQFGVGHMALHRHKTAHLSQALAKAQEAQEVARGDALLAQVRELQARATSILDAAERSGDLKTALAAIAQARGCLELLAKLLGELQEGPTVNVVLLPEWVRVRTAILNALEGYPEARLAVVEALKDVGA